MGNYISAVLFFGCGCGAAAAAFGVTAKSQAARVVWSVVLGAILAAISLWVLLMVVLTHSAPDFGMLPVKAWAFVAGVLVAGAAALYRSRGGVREWSQGGGVKRAAVSAGGVLLMIALGAGASHLMGSDAKPVAPEPVSSVQPAEPVVAQAAADGAGCACASGAVCTGARGGQYCLDGGGKKRYK